MRLACRIKDTGKASTGKASTGKAITTGKALTKKANSIVLCYWLILIKVII
ncbi:MAG: hypothetical protein ACK5MV_07755 [Aminipila sp.]